MRQNQKESHVLKRTIVDGIDESHGRDSILAPKRRRRVSFNEDMGSGHERLLEVESADSLESKFDAAVSNVMNGRTNMTTQLLTVATVLAVSQPANFEEARVGDLCDKTLQLVSSTTGTPFVAVRNQWGAPIDRPESDMDIDGSLANLATSAFERLSKPSADSAPFLPSHCFDKTELMIDDDITAQCLRAIGRMTVTRWADNLDIATWIAFVIITSGGPSSPAHLRTVALEVVDMVLPFLSKYEGLGRQLLVHMRFDSDSPVTLRRMGAKGLGTLACTIAHTLERAELGRSCSLCDNPAPTFINLPPKAAENHQRPFLRHWEAYAFLLLDNDRKVVSNFCDSLIRVIRHATPAELDLLSSQFLADAFKSALSRGHPAVGKLTEMLWGDPGLESPQSPFLKNRTFIAQSLQSHAATQRPETLDNFIEMLGQLGKLAPDPLLGGILGWLVDVTCQVNPLLKAFAVERIHNIARFRETNVPALLTQFFHHISIHVVDRMGFDIDTKIGSEVAQLLGVTVRDFFQLTLEYTLPHLVLLQQEETLQRIASTLKRHLADLLIQEAGHILTYLFLQETRDVEVALTWFTNITSSNFGNISLRRLYGACRLLLVTKLAVELGDRNEIKRNKAFSALQDVANKLSTPDATQLTSQSPPDLPTFLERYFLGIFSHISQCVSNSDGSKSTLERNKVLRCLQVLIETIGSRIANVVPQIMATLQAALEVVELRTDALAAWNSLLRSLDILAVGAVLAPATIVLSERLGEYTPSQRRVVLDIFSYLYIERGEQMASHISEICMLPTDPGVTEINKVIRAIINGRDLMGRVEQLISAVSHDNVVVSIRALAELKTLLVAEQPQLHTLMLAENVHPIIKRTIDTLLDTCRVHEGSNIELQLLCCECLGALGAPDPARLDMLSRKDGDKAPGVTGEVFATFEGAMEFACGLIERRLAPSLRSAHNVKMQGHLAYVIQELLQFCGFTKAVVDGVGVGSTADQVLRHRWNKFPKAVLETICPLVSAKYALNVSSTRSISYPIYPQKHGFRDWIISWTVDLIGKVQGAYASRVLGLCRNVVNEGNVAVAHDILPHLVLNVLVDGQSNNPEEILQEFLAVLEEAESDDGRWAEMRQMSSQTIFALIDHLTAWLRLRRQQASRLKANQARRQGRPVNSDEPDLENDAAVKAVQQLLSKIPKKLMADASYRCGAYARALLHFEQHIRLQPNDDKNAMQPLYAYLQKIYSHLDETDGMAGISTMLITPTLEQQILEHESGGNWTEAQTCYELALQRDQGNLGYQLGLLNCFTNLGHLETMLTHIDGTSARHPEWAATLNAYGIEAAWRLGNWDLLEVRLNQPHKPRFEAALGKVLHAAWQEDEAAFSTGLRAARESLIVPLSAAGMESYQRAYEDIQKLNMLHEVESFVMHHIKQERRTSPSSDLDVAALPKAWDGRLKITVPSFKVREPVLNLRRILIDVWRYASDKNVFVVSKALTGFGRHRSPNADIQAIDSNSLVGSIWLQTAKTARKAGYPQPAYSAILHAAGLKTLQWHRERGKWLWDQGQTHKAMVELRRVTESNGENQAAASQSRNQSISIVKTKLLLTRWMEETNAISSNSITNAYTALTKELSEWEKSWYHLGRYYNVLYKAESDRLKERSRVDKNSMQTVLSLANYTTKCYQRALILGTGYIYETLPRFLTIWLDEGQKIAVAIEKKETGAEERMNRFNNITKMARKLNQTLPAWMFLTAIPQLVSRICHKNHSVHEMIENIIISVLSVYPQQTMWHLVAVSKSTLQARSSRVAAIFAKVKTLSPQNKRDGVGLDELIQQALGFAEQLILLCNHPVDQRQTTFNISKNFRSLDRMAPLNMIVPLQTSMTVTMPTEGQSLNLHQPFANAPPTIHGFRDEVEIMHSLQRPRKITIIGSDGRDYSFLCKPKDDLRKDCRLMEFNAMINKLLKKDPEARKRKLHIRTYAVMPLNEECGLIEWVNNLAGLRHILIKTYRARGITIAHSEIKALMDRKDLPATDIFTKFLLPKYPPVFYEWFVEMFPEPTQWLASRLAYSTTTAVMSIVGHVVGLGDRHGENILFDETTGDCVHVDLNCLFEKGLTFEKPERVPFRLTHNMVDAFGITGVEGVFRKSCEVTMHVLREYRESLMSVLETFLYDPLCEWSKPSRKNSSHAATLAASGEQDNEQALKSLQIIKRKLEGHVAANSGFPLSIGGQVHELIEQATDPRNLALMYIGWAAYM
ncbi:serine/threonine-protein kinase M1 [Rhizophlyctis rosea]|nr:serine/threonine-protein kinase M1 [Rhizophlyctis rosea]